MKGMIPKTAKGSLVATDRLKKAAERMSDADETTSQMMQSAMEALAETTAKTYRKKGFERIRQIAFGSYKCRYECQNNTAQKIGGYRADRQNNTVAIEMRECKTTQTAEATTQKYC